METRRAVLLTLDLGENQALLDEWMQLTLDRAQIHLGGTPSNQPTQTTSQASHVVEVAPTAAALTAAVAPTGAVPERMQAAKRVVERGQPAKPSEGAAPPTEEEATGTPQTATRGESTRRPETLYLTDTSGDEFLSCSDVESDANSEHMYDTEPAAQKKSEPEHTQSTTIKLKTSPLGKSTPTNSSASGTHASRRHTGRSGSVLAAVAQQAAVRAAERRVAAKADADVPEWRSHVRCFGSHVGHCVLVGLRMGLDCTLALLV
jgi:hypothetical protein